MDFKITDININQQTGAVQNTKANTAEQPKKAKEDTKAQETTYDAVSVQGDTVSISEAGKAAEAQMDSSEEQTENQAANQSADGAVVLKATEEPVAAEEEEEIISTTNLSKYTKVELQQFYLDGDITKVEYDNELSSREV